MCSSPHSQHQVTDQIRWRCPYNSIRKALVAGATSAYHHGSLGHPDKLKKTYKMFIMVPSFTRESYYPGQQSKSHIARLFFLIFKMWSNFYLSNRSLSALFFHLLQSAIDEVWKIAILSPHNQQHIVEYKNIIIIITINFYRSSNLFYNTPHS